MISKLKKINLFYIFIYCLLFLSHSDVLFAASVVLTWTPPTANDDGTPLNDLAGYNVYYGTSSGNYSESIDVGDVLTYQVDNLSTGVTYYFTTTAYDTSGNESGYSNEMSKTFPAIDTSAPVISGVEATGITSTSVTIGWTTNETSNTQVEYGTSVSYGDATALNASMVTSHSQQISGLNSSTLYHYRVISRDASGNMAVSGDYTFTTSVIPVPVDYYCDVDDDGYINISKNGSCTGAGCVPAGCQTAQGDDCNDTASYINPGMADDTCDGVDDNCDGIPDNHYVTAAISCGTGVCTSTGQIICQNAAEINSCLPGTPPESTETTCGDNLDNDCDGQVDEDCAPDIMVSNVLLSEDFDSGTPAEWSLQGGWSTENPCGRSIGYPFAGEYVIVDSSCTATGIDEAVTPRIDTASCSNVELIFSNQYDAYSGNIDVDVSNDGGATWTNHVSIYGDDGYPVANWKEIDISSAAGVTDAQVKFRYVNDAGNGFWALDNVWVTCQSDRLSISAEMQTPSLKTLMVSNTGTDTLRIDAVYIGGADASEFSIGVNDDCTKQTLPPSESCVLDIVFTPEFPGQKSAILSVSSNDPDTPVMNVPLEGTVSNIVIPAAGIQVNSQNGVVNISRGESATATIALDPGSLSGHDADWWVLMEYRDRWYYYDASTEKWRRGDAFYRQGRLENITQVDIPTDVRWSAGRYTLYFGVDTTMNGVRDRDAFYFDSVAVDVQ
ncbi:MAG: MopE-related protein [Nitrospirota bacterium]